MVQLIETEQFQTAAFVLLCDRSHSMLESGALAVLDDFLPRMVSTLKSHKRVKETGILSIVGFSEQCEVLLPMTPITDAWTPTQPQLPSGGTDFCPPLHQAYTQLEQMPEWTARCFRPVVFFISDGQHNRGPASRWRDARARLVDRSFLLRPTIVTFGMGESDMPTLEEIASDPELAQHFPGEPLAALSSILEIVLTSTITLSQVVRQNTSDSGYVSRIRRFRYDDDDRPGDLISWKTEVP